MSQTHRWLDVLPADCAERSLLLAGKSEDPPAALVDRGWQGVSATLGIASATTLVSTQVSAQAAAATGVAATAAVTKTVGLSLVAKTIALGFTLGMGIVGASHWIAVTTHDTAAGRSVSSTRSLQSPAAPEAARLAPPEQLHAPPEQLHAPAVSSGMASLTVRQRERAPNLAMAEASSPTLVRARISKSETVANAAQASNGISAESGEAARPAEIAPKTASRFDDRQARSAASNAVPARESEPGGLADQARDLAQIKRLVDAGAFDEALRRLQSSYLQGGDFALSEERDALYIDVLVKARHLDEAKRRAQRFVKRYPSSAYLENMRHLAGSE